MNEAAKHFYTNMKLILSLFQGIGMLDSGFVNNGFCVVSGPEQILNGDVREFIGIADKFDGVIGGSPCQSFSKLNRNPNGYSQEMLNEFCRIVSECKPKWFVLENVLGVPDVKINGYYVQRFNLSPTDLGFSQSRPRTFQFGSLDGSILELPKKIKPTGQIVGCLTATDGKKSHRRSFLDFCKLQGFEKEPKLENFTKTAKYRSVGNGVHLAVSNVIAQAVMSATLKQNPKTIFNTKVCLCGCGRIPDGKKVYYEGACRMRAFAKRHAPGVTILGTLTTVA